MRYREATRDDAEAIAAIHTDSWRNTYSDALSAEFLSGPILKDRLDVWEQRLSVPAHNQHVILASDGADVVGFACAFGDADELRGTLLDNLHVIREKRGGGIGRRLLTGVAEWCAKTYPDSGLYLSVLEGNIRAQRFYGRLGAADVGGAVWDPPGGGNTPVRWYAWTKAQLAGMIANLASEA
jgi:GNAT superfamily N-acetyltransferase